MPPEIASALPKLTVLLEHMKIPTFKVPPPNTRARQPLHPPLWPALDSWVRLYCLQNNKSSAGLHVARQGCCVGGPPTPGYGVAGAGAGGG